MGNPFSPERLSPEKYGSPHLHKISDTPDAYAGDDPVDGIDPLGLWGLNPFSDAVEAAGDLGHGVATTFDAFRHGTAAAVDLPPDLILAAGQSVYIAYDQIYQDGANSCSFFALGTQEDIAAAVLADESAALLGDGEGEVDAVEDAGVSATTPVGRTGDEMNVVHWNASGDVDGISYSGHAFDQMQARGIVPSVVKDAITYGAESAGADGTTVYYSSVNNLSVVVNQEGRVVTTSWGQFKPR